MRCCTDAESSWRQSLSHGQICNVTSLIFRNGEILLLKYEKELSDMREIAMTSNICTTENQTSKKRGKSALFQMEVRGCG